MPSYVATFRLNYWTSFEEDMSPDMGSSIREYQFKARNKGHAQELAEKHRTAFHWERHLPPVRLVSSTLERLVRI